MSYEHETQKVYEVFAYIFKKMVIILTLTVTFLPKKRLQSGIKDKWSSSFDQPAKVILAVYFC